MAKQGVRIIFRSEIYIDVEGATTDEELKEKALAEFEELPLFSADALDHYADFTEIMAIEAEDDGREL